ncbi:mon2 [Symbiodinium natans]|uniref:Mon2 protein n=1 Tax=Symbiodinium natans TaxID=878477 RepID=A0A812KHG0_9DINO|nr:mon2 [Symbiodinium natans]
MAGGAARDPGFFDCESSRGSHPFHELNGRASRGSFAHPARLLERCHVFTGGVILLALTCCLAASLALHNPSLSGPRQAAKAAVLEAVPVVLVDGQRYRAVQYLGMNLFTAPGTEVDGCFDFNTEMDQCYLGSTTVRDDVARRMEILLEAVERVFASAHWDRSPTTLKIVLFPEFFWRGRQGAYRIKPGLENVTHATASWIFHQFAHERFKHWLIVDGTVVMAQAADENYVRMSQRPEENVSYYNFAPIHIGGTNLTYLKFKHFVSGIDFIRARPEGSRMVPAPPRKSHEFCKRHPLSNGCVYGRLPEELLRKLGFGRDIELPNGLLSIGGLKIGLEICLDHAMGELCNKTLTSDEHVDVQLVVSAGMNIASGPVCTARGGPVFLADGFARTEVSLNPFGRGREAAPTPDRHRRFNVGIDYGADVMVSMQQFIADTIFNITGTGFGTRFPGLSTLPGGSFSSGSTGMAFRQISALGKDWKDQLEGFYHTGSYKEAERVQESIKTALNKFENTEGLAISSEILQPQVHPTMDIYGPFEADGSEFFSELWVQIFMQLRALASDSRPEVRNCAVKSLSTALLSHGRKVGTECYSRCLSDILMKVLAEIQEAAREARLRGTSRPDNHLIVHHSRDTPEKQWDETVSLAFEGVRRVLNHFSEEAGPEAFAPLAYAMLLHIQETMRALTPETTASAVRALVDLMRIPASCQTFQVAGTLVSDPRVPSPPGDKTSVWNLCWGVLWSMVSFCLPREVPELVVEAFASSLSALRCSHGQVFTTVQHLMLLQLSLVLVTAPSFYLPSTPWLQAEVEEETGANGTEEQSSRKWLADLLGQAQHGLSESERGVFSFIEDGRSTLWSLARHEGAKPTHAKAATPVTDVMTPTANAADIWSMEGFLQQSLSCSSSSELEEMVQAFLGQGPVSA